MYPLDVIHGVCVAGELESGAGLVRGHKHAPGVRLISVTPIQACCPQVWCLACVELCPLLFSFLGDLGGGGGGMEKAHMSISHCQSQASQQS